MDDFYERTLEQLMTRGLVRRDMKVLVICGGMTDRDALHRMGFTNVTISNVDSRMRGNEFAPFSWSFQDAENLGFADDSFDLVVAHSGLHHCASPHRGLLEMYRVAKVAALVYEPRDTFLVRLGTKLDFGQEYEVAAVVGNDMAFGGFRNTQVPNYVYRWTEREIEKTVQSYAPLGRPKLHYFYALRVPEERLAWMRNRVAANTVRMLLPPLKLLTRLFPRQSNCFAFCVEKLQLPRDLHPWLALEGGVPTIQREWVDKHYKDLKPESDLE